MAPEHRIRETLESFLARVRLDLDAHAGRLTTDLAQLADERQMQWRAEMDTAIEAARTEADRAARARLETMRADMASEYESRLTSARADLRDSSNVKHHAHRLCAEAHEWLLAAVGRIDEAKSLSGILEALARATAETSRVAILMVDGDRLRTWGHFGFASGDAPVDVPIGEVGVLAAAVALKQTAFVPPAVPDAGPGGPAFMRVPAGHTALVVPIVVGREVVAVLYADDVGRQDEQEDAPVWAEQVGLLVRYAALRLENVTTIRTAEVLTT